MRRSRLSVGGVPNRNAKLLSVHSTVVEGMKITDVTAIPIEVPLIPFEEGGIAPYRGNHNEQSSKPRVLVRVDTDAGISGWGEARILLSAPATVSLIEDGIAPQVVGQSPYELESFRAQIMIEYTNVKPFFAPIEIACWDIVGKDLGKPVYELLGGWTTPNQTERERDPGTAAGGPPPVDVAYCLGIRSPEDSAAKAEAVAADGYDVLKTKAGRDWRQDVERVVAMHEAVDGELEFRLDPNQGWTLDEAVRVAACLEDEGIYLQYMEQPIRVDMHRELARLRQRTRQPIAPNEDTYIPRNLGALVDAGAMDVAVLDMTPAGGIAGLRELAAVTREAGIPSTHHCAFDLGVRTAAILHAVSGIPGFELPPDSAYEEWAGSIVEEPFTVSEGRIPVPTDPGLGVTVDLDALDRFAIEH
jgi:L-alanine-DL-glutamate epimerase-like enolase superfamily enzyme